MSKLSPYAAVKPGSSLPANLSGIEPTLRENLLNNKTYGTPPSSPIKSNPTTPVIVTNPSFQPTPVGYSPVVPIPRLPTNPVSRHLPEASGRWDNHSLTPTYLKSDLEFWASRQEKIPVTSTVSSPLLSDLEFSPLSRASTEVFEGNNIEKTVVALSQASNTFTVTQCQELSTMAVSLDPAFKSEFERLEDIKDEVELSLSEDLPVSRVNAHNAELLKQLLNEAHSKAKSYALGMTKLSRKFPTLDEALKTQYVADGKSLLAKVNQHVDILLAKINEKFLCSS